MDLFPGEENVVEHVSASKKGLINKGKVSGNRWHGVRFESKGI